MSWIPIFEFALLLLKGTHHNTTLNTDYVEHLVLSDYNLPYSEVNPTRCNNCVYSSQWLYSTCFG